MSDRMAFWLVPIAAVACGFISFILWAWINVFAAALFAVASVFIGAMIELARDRPGDLLNAPSLQDEVSRLERLVYVPGVWRCPKCNLRLISNVMDASSGRMAADITPQTCANGCGPMWRVTERDAGNQLITDYDRMLAEIRAIALDESLERGDRLQRIVARIPEAA